MFINNFILEIICEKKGKKYVEFGWKISKFIALASYAYDHAEFLDIVFMNMIYYPVRNNFSKRCRFDVENKSRKFSKFLLISMDFLLQFRLIFELEIKS